MLRILTILTCVFLLCGWVSRATAQGDLAAHAEAILKQSCADCHAGGAAEGRMNYVLNAGRMISKGKIIPNDPARSKLIKEIDSGRMPKDGDKLSQADIQTLKDWIAAGAPAFKATEEVEFISSEAILLAIVKDLSRKDIDPDDRPFFRYFTLTHLYNAGLSSDELLTYKQALFKLINSLSWEGEMHVPQPIDAHETIFRIDLRKLQWNEGTWEAILKANPYGVTHTGKTARDCYAYTACSLPYVRGDWFVFAAARPPLYHLILELPDTDLALEQRLNVKVAENIRTRQVFRNGFNESGVSAHNRMIEWHRLPSGAYIKSYDFKGSEGPRSLFEHPLGPGGANGFQHDGGEIIFNLPNGLQAYLLVDAKGGRINTGPTDVVLDKEAVRRGLQAEVVNGISCMGCHKNGMIRKEDEIRGHVTANLNAFDTIEAKLILALYPKNDDWEKLFAKGEQRFRVAVHQALGDPEAVWNQELPPTEPITALAALFQDALDLDLAAAEAGLQPQDLLDGLAREAELARKLGALRTPGGSVKREVYVAAFPLLAEKLQLGSFLIPDPAFRPILPGGGNSPEPSGPPTVYVSKSTGMTFQPIPAGEFRMGSSAADVAAYLAADPTNKPEYMKDEQPQHAVRITCPFHMGTYEVTQGEFQKIMSRNPSHFSATGGGKDSVAGKDTTQFPVDTVNWYDAVEFCNTLSVADGLTPYYTLTAIVRNDDGSIKSATVTSASRAASAPGLSGYRLPTEAEWEYSARAGTTSAYHFGNVLNGDKANVDGNSPFGTTTKGKYLERTTMVGSYPANAFGLHDMCGNLYEWCEDGYEEGLYASRSGVTSDPVNASTVDRRVLRGGSWYDGARYSRSAYRDRNTPDFRDFSSGFRIVRTR